ncbi:MAG: apolipoprotein N-acyltransferase [Bacteroidota bacterium]
MKLARKNAMISLSLLSGLLLTFSWPENGMPLLSFIALVPLLIMENFVLNNKERFSKYAVFLLSWFSFIVFNAFTTWWIVHATIPGALVAVFLNALFMALPFALMHAARRILPGKQGSVSLLIFWLSFEFLHMNWDLSWSWLNLGNAFATMPRVVQWYEYTGVLGGTAWIIIMNLCFFGIYKAYSKSVQTITVKRNLTDENAIEKQKREIYLSNLEQFKIIKYRTQMGIITLFFLLTPTIISFVMWSNYQIPSGDHAEIVIVQPSRDPYANPKEKSEEKQWADELIELAAQKITEDTRFVIAPEAALPGGVWRDRPEENYGYRQIKNFTARYDSLTWITGAMVYQLYESGDSLSETARYVEKIGYYMDIYNAAILINAQGDTEYYFKSKLVPGIEKMPWASYLKPLARLVERFGGTAGSLGVQKERTVFEGMDRSTKVAPVICYESIYGEYVNDQIRLGADLIFILTNDGWWKDTPGYRQHNQYARLRAIETRRSIARAASTGISSFITPKGQFYQSTKWWEKEAIAESLPLNDKMTFYVKSGDYIGRISVFVFILLLFYMISQKIIKKKTNQDIY